MPFTLATPVTMSTTDSTIISQPSTVNNKIPDEPKLPAVVTESQSVSKDSQAQEQTNSSDKVVNDQVKQTETDQGGQENKMVENLVLKNTSQDAGGKQTDVAQGEEATPSSSTSSSTKDQTRYSIKCVACLWWFRGHTTQTRILSTPNIWLPNM